MTSSVPLVVCWVDESIGEAGAHLPLKQHFETVSNRISTWRYFDSGDSFIEFLDGNPNMKLVTIISGRLGKCLITAISDREALHSVYVFCGNKEKYKSLVTDEAKVKGIFTSEDELYEQLRFDLRNEF